MTAKHTSGPWRYLPPSDYRQWPVVQRSVEGGFMVRALAPESAVADARLIAAAPEMLEALRACEAWIADGGHAEDGSGRDVYLAARAAIAKATGGEND